MLKGLMNNFYNVIEILINLRKLEMSLNLYRGETIERGNGKAITRNARTRVSDHLVTFYL